MNTISNNKQNNKIKNFHNMIQKNKKRERTPSNVYNVYESYLVYTNASKIASKISSSDKENSSMFLISFLDSAIISCK